MHHGKSSDIVIKHPVLPKLAYINMKCQEKVESEPLEAKASTIFLTLFTQPTTGDYCLPAVNGAKDKSKQELNPVSLVAHHHISTFNVLQRVNIICGTSLMDNLLFSSALGICITVSAGRPT